MKRRIISTALAVLVLAACGKQTPDTPGGSIPKNILVLNTGNWNSNDAEISTYNLETKSVEGGLFRKANNIQLGDLGQDFMVVGDEIYITVNGSKLVFVTDMDLKVKKSIEIPFGEGKMSPRYMAQDGGKVYVTYYEGFLAEITPGSHSVRTTAVGSYPESLCIRNGKAYVANSGFGYDNTVSVVDLASFKEEKKIVVNPNPQFVVADKEGKNLYVCSWDTFDNDTYAVLSPSKLQRVDLGSGKVHDMEGYADVKCIVEGPDNKMFVALGGYDENWQICAEIKMVGMASAEDLGFFTKDRIINYNSLSYNRGFVFVGTSDYKTNGDMYLYTADGTFVDKFDTQGLNPQKGLTL